MLKNNVKMDTLNMQKPFGWRGYDAHFLYKNFFSLFILKKMCIFAA